MEPEHSTDVYLYDPQVVEKLRDALIGTTVGETLTLDLPKVVGEGESKDTPVIIKIDKALKVTLPELTEEFCKKISRDKAATELEVRMLTREELEANAKTNSAQALEANMVEALLKKHEFEVPNTITYALIDAMIQEARESNRQKGLPEDTNIDVDEYRQRAWGQAQVRGKWLLLRDKIVEAEQIDATPEEIDALAEKDAAAYGIKKENLLTYYRKNEEVLERIKSEKLVQRLREKFVIKEKAIAPPQ